MRLKHYLSIATLSALSLGSYAADLDGPYVGLSGGLALVPDIGSDSSVKVEFDPGFTVGAQLGYKFYWLRAEIEGSFMRSEIDELSLAGVKQAGADGDLDTYAFMFNLFYDVDLFGPEIMPYLGAGIGYVHLEADDNLSVSTRFDDEDSLAYQAMVGLTYNHDEQIAVTLGYRYLRSEDKIAGDHYQNHIITSSLIYRFG